MDEGRGALLVALAAATLALVGVYLAATTLLTGATRTIEMMGYAVAALLIFEGLRHFVPNYAKL